MKALIRSFYILFALIIVSPTIIGQEQVNAKEFFVEAESYFLFEEYSDALPLYQRLLRVEKENYNVMYKVGICYLNDPYQKEKSIRYLKKASEKINPNYKIKSYKEKQAPPETNYYLGLAYRMNGNIPKALEYFKIFEESINPDVFDINVVKLEIEACERALKSKNSPIYFTKDNVGEGLNTRFAETNAIISGDGNTIVFNRTLQFYDAVFISKKGTDGKWSEPYNLTSEFGVDGNSYCTGISHNAGEIFVYRSDNFDGNIYSSKNTNGVWSKLEKLGPFVNTKYWESHASVSKDGKTLYFTSNRRGGYGGLDIYKSELSEKGKWGEPQNLGPIVNSTLNEYCPILSPDNKKLFFSSLGHTSIGGYDVFVSTLTNSGNWSSPQNMGYPINTSDDDVFFCPVEKDGFAGVQTLFDPSSTMGLNDIYWVSVYNEVLPRTFIVKGKVNTPVDELAKQKNLDITLIETETGKVVQQIKGDENGNFTLEAHQGAYQLLVDGEGIKPVSVPVELALTQGESIVELPMITAQIEEKKEENILVTSKELPKLELQSEEYILTDSTPITIELMVEEGSTLNIETYVEEQLKSKEEYLVTNERFSFQLTPEPGENTVVFRVTDAEGNVSTQEVKVYYEPKVLDEPIAEVVEEPTQFSEVALMAEDGLREYLSSLESIEYSSLSELYKQLLANAEENNYTQKEVEELISRILTQRDLDEFIADIKDIDELEIIHSNDTLCEKSKIPLSLVKSGKLLENAQIDNIDVGLIEAVPLEGDNATLAEYILTFLDYPASPTSSFNSETYEELQKSLNEQVDANDASEAIELESTTIGLESFYSNLLLSADDEFREILTNIDFDSLHINNSIDLVNYLMNNADQNGMSKISVINSIERAKHTKKQNIHDFKEALAEAATGDLKLRIQEINVDSDNINDISDIVELLLRDSQTRGYGRSEVYDLLINLIGIEDVDEFIKQLQIVSEGKLDKVLAELKRGEFSLPIEVIQYLLSQAPYYDYSDSDINELLIQMLLEKGIDNWNYSDDESYSKELIKKRRMVTTIVLVGLLLVVIIILFWRRKRKKEAGN